MGLLLTCTCHPYGCILLFAGLSRLVVEPTGAARALQQTVKDESITVYFKDSSKDFGAGGQGSITQAPDYALSGFIYGGYLTTSGIYAGFWQCNVYI